MNRINDILFTWLLRLPFFLVVYTLIFLLAQDGSASLFFLLIAVYTSVCAIDSLVEKKILFMLICAPVCVALFMLSRLNLAIVVICTAAYRSEAFSGRVNIVWIGCLCVSTVAVGFIDPSLAHICVRNVLAAAVATLLTRQMQTLSRFLSSHYCWGISRKTASAMIKRVYKMTAACLGAIIVVVLFAAQPREQAAGLVYSAEESARYGEFAAHVETVKEEAEVIYAFRDILMGAGLSEDNILPEGVVVAALVFMYVVIVLMVALLIVFMIYSIQKRAAHRFEDFDEDITEEDADLAGVSSEKRKTRLKMGADRTVRRLFRLKVREHMSSNGLFPHRYDTPEVLAGEISRWEDVDMLKRLYHKARYSSAGVSREELNDYYAWRRDHS